MPVGDTHRASTGDSPGEIVPINLRPSPPSEHPPLDQLVAEVAHEVRGPLFGISALVEALEVSPNPDRLMPHLRGEVSRLSALMEDLLAYGKPAPEVRPTRLGDVISLATRRLESLDPGPESPPTADFVQVDLPKELPRVRAHPETLARAFENLFVNARQCSPAARIRVVARPVTSGDFRWVVCDVLDSGPGIPPEDLARIWEPFFSRRTGGTGLGLAIVRRIVEQHGGSVIAGNLPEGGARFRLRLPVA